MPERARPELVPGDRVFHWGSRHWGTVLAIKPQRDGTLELQVQRDEPLWPGGPNEATWWASYHLGYGEMDADRIGRSPNPHIAESSVR